MIHEKNKVGNGTSVLTVMRCKPQISHSSLDVAGLSPNEDREIPSGLILSVII